MLVTTSVPLNGPETQTQPIGGSSTLFGQTWRFSISYDTQRVSTQLPFVHTLVKPVIQCILQQPICCVLPSTTVLTCTTKYRYNIYTTWIR